MPLHKTALEFISHTHGRNHTTLHTHMQPHYTHTYSTILHTHVCNYTAHAHTRASIPHTALLSASHSFYSTIKITAPTPTTNTANSLLSLILQGRRQINPSWSGQSFWAPRGAGSWWWPLHVARQPATQASVRQLNLNWSPHQPVLNWSPTTQAQAISLSARPELVSHNSKIVHMSSSHQWSCSSTCQVLD